MAMVVGPLTDATGLPFGRPNLDCAVIGYREEEYLLEGTATKYRPKDGTELGTDGRWDVEPAGTAPYKSRFVVYRPADPEVFNGTVLVSWNNVSAGFDGYTVDSPEVLESGYAYVAVSAQRAGVHGMGEHPMGLVQVNPARYGSLSIPSDDYSFDIFSQAAGAVGAGRARSPIDPLDGLEVRHLVAFGGSQSASRLGAYINAVQPRDRLFDAFLLYLYFGGGSPLDVGGDVFNPGGDRLERSSLPMIPCRIRDDLDALVMIVNSEVEAISCYGVRQSETERFRYWEAAGTAHVSLQNSAIPAPGNPLGFLAGSCVPFSSEKVRSLYSDVDRYLNRFEQATRAAEQAGVLLARDAEPLLREAKAGFERATVNQ